MTIRYMTGVQVVGIVVGLPKGRETLDDLSARFGAEAAARIAGTTGISARHIAAPGTLFSNLATPVATRLLTGLNWPPESVGLLITVTQTGDHVLPATSCLLQHKLGLAKGSAAFDITLGCSGYVYGLWVAAGMMRSSGIKRALLVAGDITSQLLSEDDRSVRPLFGDAVSATALAMDDDGNTITNMIFDLGSDGAGGPYLIARRCSKPRLFMDGTQVFAFTLREIPKSIKAVLDAALWSIDDVDAVVLHQANAMMISHLGAKISVKPNKLVMALEDVGNTSSASIPLAMVSALKELLSHGPQHLLLSGFGVGWSWASAAVTIGPLALCERITLSTDQMS